MQFPGQPRYYPLIDSVLFDDASDEESATRAVGATSALFVDLIVHQTVPVLSQSQVIDSAFVLDAVRDDTTHDAFISMVTDSLIQTRFRSDGLEPSPDEDPFTVLNVFASLLRSDFHFSAWPELADPAVREQLYAAVRGSSREPLAGELGERLDALRVLDAAFRNSTATERAQPVSGNDQLGPRVLADLHAQPAQTELHQLGESVERLARAAGTDDQGRPLVDLNARSAWRRALPEAARTRGIGSDTVADASSIVDMHYNSVVALSLGAASSMDETVAPHVPLGLRQSATTVEFDPRVTFLVDPARAGRALTWATVREHAARRRFDSPGVRLERLFDERLIETVDRQRLVKVVAATPRRLLRAAHGGVPAGLAGFEVGGHFGLFGAVLGGVVGEAMTPDEFLLGGEVVGRWEAMVRRRAVSQLRRSLGVTVKADRT